MKTFKRIKKLQDTILSATSKTDLIVADIATDHGYLAEALSKCDNVKKIIATDISKKCLSKLERLIKKCNLVKIEILVGDGLNPITNADIACIAGIGGFEIIKMLEHQNIANGGVKCPLFVLQPAQNWVELRKWIFEKNYKVLSDVVIHDAGRFYPIITIDVTRFEKNEQSVKNLFLGRDIEDEKEDFYLYLQDQLVYLQFLEKLPKDRIETDAVLKEKLELKIIIEKLLN